MLLFGTDGHIILCGLVDLPHVDVKERERVVFTTGNAPDLQEADLRALAEALEDARRWHNIF